MENIICLHNYYLIIRIENVTHYRTEFFAENIKIADCVRFKGCRILLVNNKNTGTS